MFPPVNNFDSKQNDNAKDKGNQIEASVKIKIATAEFPLPPPPKKKEIKIKNSCRGPQKN